MILKFINAWKFSEALAEHFPYKVRFASHTEVRLVSEWCKEQFGVSATQYPSRLDTSLRWGYTVWTVRFKNESDAILFKLQFGSSTIVKVDMGTR